MPVSRWSKFWAVVGAGRGRAPYGLRSPVVYEVRDRQSGEVVYHATTQSDLSLQAWQESLTSDLNDLTAEQFNEKHGLGGGVSGSDAQDEQAIGPPSGWLPVLLGYRLAGLVERMPRNR